MTAIPSNFNLNDNQKDLARSTVALLGVLIPQAAVKAAGSIPAVPVVVGNKPYRAGTWIRETAANETKLQIQLPYSPRLFAVELSLAKSLLTLFANTVVPVIKAATAPVAISAPVPASLEEYILGKALALRTAGSDVQIQQVDDGARSFVQITATLPAALDTLLDGSGGGVPQG